MKNTTIRESIVLGLMLGASSLFLLAATPIKDLVFQSDVEAGGHQITGLGSPTNSSNAATLAYVTNQISTAATNYATAAQGATADSAVQPGDVIPLTDGGTGSTNAADARTALGLGTAATNSATAFATAAQGLLADSAVQPIRTISTTAPLTGGGNLTANLTLAISAAATNSVGAVQLATDAEIQTGTDTAKAVRPSGLAAWWTWVKTQAQTFTGNLTVNGNTTLGDASGDTLTINAGTITAPNQTAASASSVMTRALAAEEGLYYATRAPAISELNYSANGGAASSYGVGRGVLQVNAGGSTGDYGLAAFTILYGNGGGGNLGVPGKQIYAMNIGFPTNDGTYSKLIAAVGATPVSGTITAKGFSCEIFPNVTNDMVLTVHNGTTAYTATLQTPWTFFTESLRLILVWDGVSTLSAYVVPIQYSATPARAALLGSVTASTPPTGSWSSGFAYISAYKIAPPVGSNIFYISDVSYEIRP